MGAFPTPLSLEKTALRTPSITRPQKPPATAVFKLNASKIISLNVGITSSKFTKIMKSPIKKYKATITGTKFEVTFTIDFKPPNITKPLAMESRIPIINFHCRSPIIT